MAGSNMGSVDASERVGAASVVGLAAGVKADWIVGEMGR